MAKLIAKYDIVCIGGNDIDLRALSQKQLKSLQKLYPHLVEEEKTKAKNEVPQSEPSESDIAPDLS